MANAGRPRIEIDYRHITPKAPDADSYRVQVVKAIAGSKKPFTRATHCKTLKDAITYRDQALAEFAKAKAGKIVAPAVVVTVEQWCNRCFDEIMPNDGTRKGKPYKANTIAGYIHLADRTIIPILGDIPLKALTRDHVRRMLTEMGQGPKGKLNTLRCLSRVCNLAVAEKLIDVNPCADINVAQPEDKTTGGHIARATIPQGVGKRAKVIETVIPAGLDIEDKRVLSFDEEKRVLKFVRRSEDFARYETAIVLGLWSALRIGEAIGLDLSAVDLDAGTITVHQQAQVFSAKLRKRLKLEGGRVQVTKPKRPASSRVLDMPPCLVAHLRQMLADRQEAVTAAQADLSGAKDLQAIHKAEKALAVAQAQANSPHVLCNEVGGRMDRRRLADKIAQIMDSSGVHDQVVGRKFVPKPSYHDFRRTLLTRLAHGTPAPGVNVPPMILSDLILVSGHDDIETLNSYYVKGSSENVRAAMQLVA